jgi:hypothetical protein
VTRIPLPALVLSLVTPLAACQVRRYFEFSSTPSGAEVRLDDDVVGTTPVRVPFEHFGARRVTYYLPGYRTSTQHIRVRPRWFSRFPLDLVTEVLLPIGLRDRRRVHENLVQGEELMNLPSLRSVIERARALRESGPEGPRDLPKVRPALVPSEPEPPEAPETPRKP